MSIIFGPGGTNGEGINGLKEAADLGLKALEVEFTNSIYMSNESAKEFGEVAKKFGISLSIHAPYYINLCSEEKPKIHASMTRILTSCERGHYLGAKYIVFHAAYYGKRDKKEIYEEVKKRVLEMQEKIKEKKWGVCLCPETTGKGTQFGDLDELSKLAEETGCGVCVDFAHLKARYNGKIDFEEVMKKAKKIKILTCHFSGIEYGEKGERRHLITENKDIEELLKLLIKHKIETRIINESPDPYGDSVKSLKIYEKIK